MTALQVAAVAAYVLSGNDPVRFMNTIATAPANELAVLRSLLPRLTANQTRTDERFDALVLAIVDRRLRALGMTDEQHTSLFGSNKGERYGAE